MFINQFHKIKRPQRFGKTKTYQNKIYDQSIIKKKNEKYQSSLKGKFIEPLYKFKQNSIKSL